MDCECSLCENIVALRMAIIKKGFSCKVEYIEESKDKLAFILDDLSELDDIDVNSIDVKETYVEYKNTCFKVTLEDEKYLNKRLTNKVTIVTGGAQGFGKGIVDELIKEGALICIADFNIELAQKVADELNKEFGAGRVIAVKADVSNEESVKNMVSETVKTFGGIDILVNNAGIVRAGTLDEMELSAFDLVTKVNYNAYFLCTKYVSKIMKLQYAAKSDYFMDIVQVSSKSGLTGSNKNFAYAGSKFGGIGLTQSFALELCPYNIKVNSVCPGNFLDGPLWTDPVNGLFVQYFNSGKVPGAKSVADVKAHYEKQVPMNRGCFPLDVARAIFYCVEQKYETGQAIPITGGQIMLN